MNEYIQETQIEFNEVSVMDIDTINDIVLSEYTRFQFENGSTLADIFFQEFMDKSKEHQDFTSIYDRTKGLEFSLQKHGCHLNISQEDKELLSSDKMIKYENNVRTQLKEEAHEAFKTALAFSKIHNDYDYCSIEATSILLKEDSYDNPDFAVGAVEEICSNSTSKDTIDSIVGHFIMHLENFNAPQMKRIYKFANNSYFTSVFDKAIIRKERRGFFPFDEENEMDDDNV